MFVIGKKKKKKRDIKRHETDIKVENEIKH